MREGQVLHFVWTALFTPHTLIELVSIGFHRVHTSHLFTHSYVFTPHTLIDSVSIEFGFVKCLTLDGVLWVCHVLNEAVLQYSQVKGLPAQHRVISGHESVLP